jgi:protocatechuate 3,4-dioxygenase beta subunit
MKTAAALFAALLTFPALAAGLEGYVYALDGTPVDGATIAAYIPEGSAEQEQRWAKRGTRTAIATTTTENGRFALATLPESIIDIDVRTDGFAPAIARVLAGDAPVTITLEPAKLVDSRVVVNRKPLANAYVVWTGMNQVEFAATTDANGRYRVPDPTHWAHEPRVFHASGSFVETGRSAAELELQPRPKVAMPTGTGTISGTVRIGDKPIAGVPVMIQGTSDQYMQATRVVTDAKGRYLATSLPNTRTYVGPGEGLEPRIRTAAGGRMEVEGSASSTDLSKEAKATIDLTLFKAPLITGRVVDAGGKPVGAAQVQVVLAGRSSLEFMHEQSGRTLADGRYAISAPPFQETETVQVAVASRGRSTVRSKAFTIGSGNHTIDITLPQFQNVTLRVVDRANKPIPNAQVAFAESEEVLGYHDARALLMPQFASRTSRANASGEVALQLAPGTYDFAASADDFQTAGFPGRVIARAAAVDLTLEQSFTIRGRVHRNGTGVANVNVMLHGGAGMMREHGVTTDANGRFELKGLARDKYRIGISKHEEMIQRTVTAEAPGTIEIALPPAGVLRGVVVDADTREPVRDFMYSVEPLEPADENARYGRPMMQRGGASPDGTFSITVSAGSYRVSATANGYTASAPMEVRVSEREPADVELTLDRGITISGRVIDESGAPVEGADVFVTGDELNQRRKRSATRGGGPGNTRTLADGTFAVTGIEPGSPLVTVRKEGFVPYRKAVQVDASTSIDVQLSRGLALEGIVTRAGKPLEGVQVGASTAAIGGDHQPAMTDRNGRFMLQGLIAARYTIHAYRDELTTEVRDVDPTKQREIAISLDAKPSGIIAGVVTGIPTQLGGKIVRRVVFVHSEERGAEGLIDEAGNYRIENAPTGNVFVTAQIESTAGGRSSQRRQVTVLPGQETRLDLDVSAGTNVTGRVSHEDKPLGGVRVIFATQEGIGSSATTRADGMYEVALPAPGTYQIYAHAEAVASRHYQSVREIRGGETVDIDLREQIVEGVVLDAETRQPLAHAFVTLAPEGAAVESVAGETVTDANGRFRTITAAAGAYRVVAWAGGYAPRDQSVSLGGTPRSLTFELARTEPLRVRVVDSRTGTPLEAHVVIQTIDAMPVRVRGDRTPDGEWFLFSLAPGEYRLTAVVHGYATKVIEVKAPGTVEVRM